MIHYNLCSIAGNIINWKIVMELHPLQSTSSTLQTYVALLTLFTRKMDGRGYKFRFQNQNTKLSADRQFQELN